MKKQLSNYGDTTGCAFPFLLIAAGLGLLIYGVVNFL